MKNYLPMHTGKKTPAQLINRAWRSLQKGEFDKAVSACRAVLDSQPDQFDATYVMGVVRLQQGRIAEAADLLGAALRMRPNDVGVLLNYGNLLAKTGHPQDGLVNYDKAIALRPDLAEAHVNRGNVLLELHRNEDALSSYEQALALKPEAADAIYGRGNVHFRAKRYDEALAQYDQVLALSANHAHAHNQRGRTLFRLGRFDEAAVSHAKAVALMPRNSEFHTNNGTALRALGRLVDADASYRRSLRLNKAHVPIKGDIGIIEMDGMRSLHLGTPISQSTMRIDRPFELIHSYRRALMSFLLFAPRARDVLAIGLGGGSVPKFLHRFAPGIRTRVVEIDADVITVARSHFEVPDDDERLQVIRGDGAQYLRDHPGSADALLLDIFDGLGTPRNLYSQRFFDDCRMALTGSGPALIHLWSFDAQFDLFVERIRRSFAGRILKMPLGDSDSIIVVGLPAGLGEPAWATLAERAALLETTYGIEFGTMVDGLRSANPPPEGDASALVPLPSTA
ncbi:tetratricopeptide repeat protein [Reyranella sp.]|uniref:tetratricopeptide repeat protein n=1 Tax=Reyranella sp. TaxID=1929291 RepID=UPI0037843769